MNCGHHELRTVSTRYDPQRGVLVYFWICERCGRRLHEIRRLRYRPNFVEGGASQPRGQQSPT